MPPVGTEISMFGLKRYGANIVRADIIAGLLATLCTVSQAVSPAALPENLAGRPTNPLEATHAVTVLIFISTTCPLSQRYSPEIHRLEAEFRPRGVVFWLVDPAPTDTPSAIRAFLKAYGYSSAARVLRDPGHVLVKETGVQITPEAVVFAEGGHLAYRGRIDNWYIRLGWQRRAPTTHDLEAAISAVLADRQVSPRFTQAVGCFIADMQ
jgi:hypothetical protein